MQINTHSTISENGLLRPVTNRSQDRGKIFASYIYHHAFLKIGFSKQKVSIKLQKVVNLEKENPLTQILSNCFNSCESKQKLSPDRN